MYLSKDFPTAYLNLVSELIVLREESATLNTVSEEISSVFDTAAAPHEIAIDIIQLINTSVPCDPALEQKLEPLFEVFEKHNLYTLAILRNLRKINSNQTKDEQITALIELYGLLGEGDPILQYVGRYALLTRMGLFGYPNFPHDVVSTLLNQLKSADEEFKKTAFMLPSQLFPAQ